jgi:sec-independent protein translocase protein TatA
MFYSKPYWDLLIVVLILVLFFGPKRLPQLGRSLGQGMREFKDSITGKSKDEEHPELNAATEVPTAPQAAREPAQPASVSGPADGGTSAGASEPHA